MGDALTVALTLLGVRELSEAQLRARLTRRQFDPGDIDAALDQLKADGTLSDRRVALALARMESAIRHRGRARVIQKIRQAGIAGDLAEAAVREVFEEVDEHDLLRRALARRLKGRAARDLDERARARVVRGLAAQGFSLDLILKELRTLQ
jgi:regulatory protein